MAESGVDAGTRGAVLLSCGGVDGAAGGWGWGRWVGFSSADIAGKRGLARAHSVSPARRAGRRHGEADKEERHTAPGQHAPGGWGIIPPRRVGGAAGGRSVRG